MKRILTFILIYALIVSQAFAIPFIDRHEAYKYGNGTTSTKSFEYDFGLGVLNPKMQVDNSQGFVFDKALSSQGLTSPSLSVTGTGTATFSGKGLFLDDLTGKNLKASGNALTIGDGAASSKAITFDKGAGASNPFMKWDETQAALVYSNDGTLVKKIGSGSGGGDGGGVNFLKNGGFEDLKANWTESGGTFTAEAFATGIESDLKFGQWVATSASQTLCSDLVATPSFANAGGMFDLAYTASGSQFLVYVKDGSGNKLTSDQSLLDQTAWTKLSPIPFSFNTSQRLCFESKGAATLKLNNVYMGTNKGTTSISQAKLLGVINYKNCNTNWTTSSTTFANFSPLASCTVSLNGDVYQPTTLIPGVRLKNAQKGTYRLDAEGFFYGGNGATQYFRFSDGTNVSTEISGMGQQTVANLYLPSISHTIKYGSVQSDVTLQIQALTSNATYAAAIYTSGPYQTLSIKVWYFPDSSEQVQTPEASQWFIDANIGGANPSLGIAAVSSYTELTNSGLDLVINSSKGSATAEIACASGYASSGLTCSSSNESVGIAFVPPYSGKFRACASFAHVVNLNTSASVASTFQLVSTQNSSSTIIEEGGDRIQSGMSSGTDNPETYFPQKVCGVFNFSDTSKKTVRLMYEQSVGGTPVTSVIAANRGSTNGQLDIHWTVEPILQNSLRAILTGDQVTSPNVKNPEIFSFSFGTGSIDTVCSASPCSYLDQIGDRVTSVVRNATGSYRAYFNKTYSKLKCTKNAYGTSQGSSMFGVGSCTNCSSVLIRGVQATSNTDMDIFADVICHGY